MKLRIISILVAISASIATSFAQKIPQKAPLNPEFVQYMELQRSQPQKKSADGKGLGYVPGPFNLHFDERYVKEISKKSVQALPSSYNLRTLGYVTPVKDQGPVGACWSFSTMGAIESRWLRLSGTTYDLSEQNLATCHGFNAGIDDGGSDFIAAAYLTRLSGPVTEGSHAYDPRPTAACKTTGLIYPRFSPTVTWLPKDIATVKKAIYEYGAVTSSMYTGGSAINSFYNLNNKTFYYGGTTPVDHGVLVVGWDDNKTVTGGSQSPGQTTGAWIVKNSWGTSWGDQGYFYVAYKDTKFLSSVSLFPEMMSFSTLNDTLYMHDYLGATSSYGFGEETAYGLVKFTAPTQHFVRKVGTFLNSTGTVVDIEIYDTFQGDTLLKDIIASSYGNVREFPGYYTFDLPAVVQGDYYVKIKYKTPGYNYPVPAEAKITFQGEVYAEPIIENPGKYWLSEDNLKWKPLGKNIEYFDADLSIRVYADKSTSLNAYFESDRVLTCIGTPVTFTDKSNGEVSTYSWDFGQGASPATATTKGPHSVNYSGTGMKNVSLTITGPGGTKTLTRSSYVEVVSELDIFLPYSEKLLIEGKSLPLTAFGAQNYTWSPSTGLNTTTGATVIASPLDTIVYTVSGTLGSCIGSTTIKINVVKNPDNDDVCDALQIDPAGGWLGKFSNVYATVEDEEPAPPEGECNLPLQWCVEGGLHNSVWFTFIGPQSGIVSIDSRGMDNQIAVYKAVNCDSILSGKFVMVAANDDYYDQTKFFAAAIERINVTPGARYYLQVDGSAGGAEGPFDLYIFNYPLGDAGNQYNIGNSGELNVYPNPGSGVFTLSLPTEVPQSTEIRVLEITGKIIYRSSFLNTPGMQPQIDLSTNPPGMYLLEVRTSNGVFRKNILLQK
jgi:C1A family cysteine protease/PKD repeat protein